MKNPPNRGRCSWEAGLGVGPRCLSRNQGEDGRDRDRGEIRNLQSKDRQEEVDRGSLEPEGHEQVTGVPWRTSEDDDKVDGEKFAKLQVPEEAIRKHDEDVEKEREMAHESMPRSFFITKKDMKQHGYSAKCPGCASVIRGTTRQRTPRRAG